MKNNQQQNRHFKVKLITALFLASLASLGNIPYGYRFSHSIFYFWEPIINISGYMFATTAVVANIALGSYSLLSVEKKDLTDQKPYVAILSVLGSLPVGFICFLGYLTLLPIYINVILSSVVALVNAGISMRALLNVLNAFSNIESTLSKNLIESLLRAVGFLIGTAVSFVGYVAASSSLFMLFNYFYIKEPIISNLSYSISIITWIPFAALFAYSTQKVIGDIYELSSVNKKSQNDYSYTMIFIGIVSILSASSLTQMVLELFKPENNIPEFLKHDAMQIFIYKLLAPMTFLSSAAVNLIALKGLLRYMKLI